MSFSFEFDPCVKLLITYEYYDFWEKRTGRQENMHGLYLCNNNVTGSKYCVVINSLYFFCIHSLFPTDLQSNLVNFSVKLHLI